MDRISGKISRVIFENRQNHFAVLLLERGEGGAAIATGTVFAPIEGQSVAFEGNWVEHPKYGRQFTISSVSLGESESAAGIAAFLKSSLVKGVGEAKAALLLERFGESVGEVIEKEPERLAEVPGIAEKTAKLIHDSYMENREMRDAMISLLGYGVPPGLATRLYAAYGNTAAAIVEKNPYALIGEVDGIAFKRADAIALKAGFDLSSPHRSEAGCEYALIAEAQQGNCFIEKGAWAEKAAEILGTGTEAAFEGIEALIAGAKIIVDASFGQERCYLPPYYEAEARSAERLAQIASQKALAEPELANELLADYESHFGVRLEASQRIAVLQAATEPASVITGGPGTGKTTIVRAVAYILGRMGMGFALAAPTGRAAKRLAEATSEEAKTIHRLLECVYERGRLMFLRSRSNPLEASCVIVDEMSMVYLPLFSRLLDAADPQKTKLVFVGDKDQLPSVSAGNVLNDIIASGQIPVTHLKHIFRQKEGSSLVVTAHRINQGKMPLASAEDGAFQFVEMSGQEAIASYVVGLVAQKAQEGRDLIFSDKLQIITPLKKGEAGAVALNKRLQEFLNPPSPQKAEVAIALYSLREGDKIMQVKNDYQAVWESAATRETGQGVFNGDIGIVEAIDASSQKVAVLFDGDRRAIYGFGELDNITLAYAITIHKGQGSEFEQIFMPLFQTNPAFLSRNLLYTAITRAKRQAVVVGEKRVVQHMVQNSHTQQRQSGLADMIKRAFANAGVGTQTKEKGSQAKGKSRAL
ncbi:MAG: ATP-dependent RecD-like DNA helicase [Eubacteriaceae bacterium]|nr:ATP-dependent RecD-like DNA helicase [Eubacteriaceae bacterium]